MDRGAKLCMLEHAELQCELSQTYDDEIPGILDPAVTNYWQIRAECMTPHIETDKLRDQGHIDYAQADRDGQDQPFVDMRF